jgi:hypothetical protein
MITVNGFFIREIGENFGRFWWMLNIVELIVDVT